MLRRPARLAVLVALLAAGHMFGAADFSPERFARVEVAPAKTSIYVGSVTMTMPVFVRTGSTYDTSYTAKVFPYFFYNERGRLSIDTTDDQLRALDRGETIEFKGRGVSTSGEERRVEGKATPANATEGKIKVRVFVSKRIELIFNTTYRLAPAPVPAASDAAK